MKINIIADSSINLFKLKRENDNINFITVPFVISIGEKNYIDDENINIESFMEDMVQNKSASRTSCPSTQTWYEEFKKPGDVIAITISSNLSGSYNSAFAAKNMILEEEPTKKVGIVNSYSTGPAMEIMVDMIEELMEKGLDANQIADEINSKYSSIKTIFALCSFDNLVKNGRMNKITGFMGAKFHLWGIGIASDVGTIKIKGVVPGIKGAVKAIIDDIQTRLHDVKKVVIHHANNISVATKLNIKILEAFPNATVSIEECRGLCSYYAEKSGLIISFC